MTPTPPLSPEERAKRIFYQITQDYCIEIRDEEKSLKWIADQIREAVEKDRNYRLNQCADELKELANNILKQADSIRALKVGEGK